MADTMSPSATPHPWTYADYARLPDDGNRYEVLDGEVLVTPAPTTHHQHVLFMLGIALHDYVQRYSLGHVLPDVDVLFAKGQFLRPDLVFVPADRRNGIADRGIEVPPGLVVEVLSPSSKRIDKVRKPRRYGDFGIPEYWVLDPREAVMWVWRFAEGITDPSRHEGPFEWRPAAAPEPLVLDPAELSRPL
jgi:Uma2 family endonuclease